MSDPLYPSAFGSLPVVTFVNVHRGSTLVVWVCDTPEVARALAAELAERPHLAEVQVHDACVKDRHDVRRNRDLGAVGALGGKP